MKLLVALCCCVAAALATSATAAADSLVFIRAGNVWLANADGSGQYQVTLDGTPSSPYSSPSQADDGTIVALRTPPGGRPQIWRMHQNGGLVNPPINTPAPGTGAIDARVSPDGQLVAYWFVTEVSTGTCLYCFDLATRVLISHSDRFTTPDEVGTPNTGSNPSWMSNDTLLMSNGNATQWYYKLGMTEAAEWWGDSDNCNTCSLPAIVNLTQGEVSRDGQRIALVRGDNQETLALYKTNGAPPALPTPECAFTGATGGKFNRPAWSQNGQTLAWQEGNGIWSAQVPDITNCATITPSQLIVAGGAEPDFGPAAVNPGTRPPCGSPGNPTACQPPPHCACPPPNNHPGPTLAQRLSTLVGGLKRALGHAGIRGLVHNHQVVFAFAAPGAGTLMLRFSTSGRHGIVVASGKLAVQATGQRNVTLKLTSAGLRLLRHTRHLKGSLTARFVPRSGAAGSFALSLSLSR